MQLRNLLLALIISFVISNNIQSSNLVDPDIALPTTNNYGDSLISDEDALNRMKFIIDGFSINLKKTILDIGCGYGKLSIALAKLGAKKIYAVDLAIEHIDTLNIDLNSNQNKHLQTYVVPIVADFNKSEIMNQILIKNTFSFILAHNILQFWTAEDIENGLNRIYEALEPGGKLLLIVQNPLENDNIAMALYEELTQFLNSEAMAYFNVCGKESNFNLATTTCQNKLNHYRKKLNDSLIAYFQLLKTHNPNLYLAENNFLYPVEMRLPFFPFEYQDGTSGLRHILFRKNLHQLLNLHGFEITDFTSEDRRDSIRILAAKPTTVDHLS